MQSCNLVLLPRQFANRSGISENAEAGGDRAQTADLTVLVVDDQRELADLTAELLRLHGVNAAVAYSGDDALAFLREVGSVDAIVTDVMMPGMNGIELAKLAVAEYPNLSIVLTSGYVFEYVNFGAPRFPFLRKPYTIETVLARILDQL